jgi:hypothetical protein
MIKTQKHHQQPATGTSHFFRFTFHVFPPPPALHQGRKIFTARGLFGSFSARARRPAENSLKKFFAYL